MNAKYVCTICDQQFEKIPETAIQLTPGEHRINTFRFTDGTIHSLRRAVAPGRNARALHNRWHKTPVADCVFCYPPPVPPEPEVTPALPESKPELPGPSEPEVPQTLSGPDEVNTSMAAAFRRSWQTNRSSL